MSSKKQQIQGSLALLITAAVWGLAFVFQKSATEELATSFIIASRFTIAGVIVAIATIKKWKRIDKGYLIGGLITGGTMALGTALQTIAMTYGTTPGKSAFLTAAYCVFVPFLCWLFLKERPKKNHIISAIICIIGIGLISLNDDLSVTLGDVITLVCSLVFAANIVSIAYFCRGRDPMLITMLQICVAALFGWGAVLAKGSFPAAISLSAMRDVLYLALFSTALSLSLQSFGLKYINATVATIILSLESVFGIIFSVILYNEVVTPRIGAGFGVVFIAVLLSQLEFIKKDKKTPDGA